MTRVAEQREGVRERRKEHTENKSNRTENGEIENRKR